MSNEVMIPPWIMPEEEQQEWLDEGSTVFRAQFAPGLSQSQSYGGPRLKLSRRHTVRQEELGVLLAVLKNARGRYRRIYTRVHQLRRGEISVSELLSNNTFENGTTGWSASTSSILLSESDRRLRSTRNGATEAPTINGSSVTTEAYSPYVFRAMVESGRGPLLYGLRLGSTDGGNEVSQTSTSLDEQTLQSLVGVPTSTTLYPSIRDAFTGKVIGEDYMEFPYASVSRCFLIDNGMNLVTRSDEFSNAAWTKTQLSVSSAAVTSPNGLSTVGSLIESADTGTHALEQSVTVSSSVLDYGFGVALRAGARTWAAIRIVSSAGSVTQYFDLGNGAVGTNVVGTDWANLRAYIKDMGDGWYHCTVVATKNSSDTTITAEIRLATADGTSSYTGDGTSNIYAWRGTLAQTQVPSRLVLTTSAASSGESQTGSALYVKGLPVSTSDLLLADDWFEINGELKQVIDPLHSDALGLGYLRFTPALIRSPSNDDPVIVHEPMGKFLISNLKIGNRFGTQAEVTYDLEHVYD